MEHILLVLWPPSHAQGDLTWMDQISGNVRIQEHGHKPLQLATKVNNKILLSIILFVIMIEKYYYSVWWGNAGRILHQVKRSLL